MLFGADIIHAHNTYPCGYAVSRLSHKKPLPFVMTPHGKDIRKIPEIDFGMRLDPIKTLKIKAALDRAQLLTAISSSIKQSLVDAGASEDKIINIPNGIDLERFRRGAALTARKKWEIKDDCRIILTVGNYRPLKGHEILIKAMPSILRRHPDAQLLIVGRDTGTLNKTIKDVGLADNVILTGAIPFYVSDRQCLDGGMGKTDLLAALYRICDVYVSASMNEGAEGLSLSLLDAMGAGKAVVATDISGNRDLIADGKTGLLVPPSDSATIARAVVKILDDKVLQKKISDGAREVATRYSWENVAKQYLSVYRCAAKMCQL
jgi:glycosyltransferase involved in cell wall biosynthesis